MTALYQAQTLQEALAILQDTRAAPLAGGTDLIPQLRAGTIQPPALLDISPIPDLAFIQEDPSYLKIGACTTLTEILHSSLLEVQAPSLLQACKRIGSVQTRNRGTLGGNVGNASPAGDTLPPLLIHQAQVALLSAQGERLIDLNDFLMAPGKTARKPGELIHYLRLEKLPRGMKSTYLKVGNRRGMAVSVASAALALIPPEKAGSPARDARLALGAVAPTVLPVPSAESMLTARPFRKETIQAAAREAAERCAPIDDLRASRTYRKKIVENLVLRAFSNLMETPQ